MKKIVVLILTLFSFPSFACDLEKLELKNDDFTVEKLRKMVLEIEPSYPPSVLVRENRKQMLSLLFPRTEGDLNEINTAKFSKIENEEIVTVTGKSHLSCPHYGLDAFDCIAAVTTYNDFISKKEKSVEKIINLIYAWKSPIWLQQANSHQPSCRMELGKQAYCDVTRYRIVEDRNRIDFLFPAQKVKEYLKLELEKITGKRLSDDCELLP